MPTIKIGFKRQITIPTQIFKQLSLKEGDFLEVKVEENGIRMVPQKLIPKDQAWFWTEEWQEGEREAEEDIRSGRAHGPYVKAKDLLRALKGR